MTYTIRVERVEHCIVEADNYEEALLKVFEGDCDAIFLQSCYYTSVNEDNEED